MGVTKKIGAATNSRKNYKRNYKRKPAGELICKKFGVHGTLLFPEGGRATTRLLRTLLRRVLETAFEKVPGRVLRRRLAGENHPKRPPTQINAEFAQTSSEQFVPSRPKLLQKTSLQKYILEAINLVIITKTLCIRLKKTRERPQKYYKNNCFKELFCNNFGQDGTNSSPLSLEDKQKIGRMGFAQTVSANSVYLGGWLFG